MNTFIDNVRDLLKEPDTEYTAIDNPLFDIIFSESYDDIKAACGDLITPCVCPNRCHGESAIIYRCRTCGKSDQSCICEECFLAGDHEGHDYERLCTVDHFTCDCGNELSWSRDGFCSKHGHPFVGNAVERLPEKYRGVYPHLRHLLLEAAKYVLETRSVPCTCHKCQSDDSSCSSCEEEGCYCAESNNSSGLEVIFQMGDSLSEMYVFFLIFAAILNEPTDIEYQFPDSEPCTHLTIGEALIIGSKNHLSESLDIFLASFLGHAGLLQMRAGVVMRLFNELARDEHSVNGHLIATFYTPFFMDGDNASSYVKTYLSEYLRNMKSVLSNLGDAEDTRLSNLCDSLPILAIIADNAAGALSREDVLLYLECTILLSNRAPITKADQAEDEAAFVASQILLPLKQATDSVIAALTDEQAVTYFDAAHSLVMGHLSSYLVDAPITTFRGVNIHDRTIGGNQPISALSPCIYLHTLWALRVSNMDALHVTEADARLLVESSLMDLAFRHQSENGEWEKARNASEYYNMYVSPIHYELVHSDLALVQLMTPAAGTDFVVATAAHIYRMETTDADPCGFTLTMIQLVREHLIPAGLQHDEIARLLVLHLMVCGIVDIEELSSLLPFCPSESVSAYKYVSSIIGSADDRTYDRVDPFFPLPIEMQQALLDVTVTGQKSIKRNKLTVKHDEAAPSNIQMAVREICSSALLRTLVGEMLHGKARCYLSSLVSDMLLCCEAAARNELTQFAKELQE